MRLVRLVLLAVLLFATACPERPTPAPREGAKPPPAGPAGAEQTRRELEELARHGYAGIGAEQLLAKLKQRYRSRYELASEGCALWALLDAVEQKTLAEPGAVEAAIRLARARIAALKPAEMDTTVGTAQGLGFVATRAIMDERKFTCADPDADFGLLDGEAARAMESVRVQIRGGFDSLHGQAPAHLRGPVYFAALLDAKLERILLEVVPALNRKLFAERPTEPFMLQCGVRYLKRKAREEPWGQTLEKDSSLNSIELTLKQVAVAARDVKLQAPSPPPSERRSYVTLKDYTPMDCVDVVSEAMKAAAPKNAEDEQLLGGMSVLIGVGTETDMALAVMRAPKVEAGAPGFPAPYVLGMAITYGGRVRIGYFAFDKASFAKQRFQLTIAGPNTILWPQPLPLIAEELGETSDKQPRSIKVQGVEVTCTPAPCDPAKHSATMP
jgi:hypothetical protein